MRLKCFRSLIGILVFSVSSSVVKAQIPDIKAYLPSANATEMQRYGETPVSFYTGTPNISIPLPTISQGQDQIPIEVSYHAGGVLPDQHPGWLGVGWSLRAGGVISRRVNGIADDFLEFSSTPLTIGKKGFYYTYQRLDNNSWNTKSFIENGNTDTSFRNADLEPDEFSFMLPSGISGKFYFNHLRQIVVQADHHIKVELNPVFMELPVPKPTYYPYIDPSYYHSKCFGGFIVTDMNGVKYHFGSDPNTVEFSINIMDQNRDSWIATSWYLKTIEYPTTRTVTFEYERGDFTAQFFHSINHVVSNQMEDGSNFFDVSCLNSTLSSHIINASYPLAAIKQYERGSLISPVYLKKINFGTTAVDFYTSRSTELRYDSGILSVPSYNYYQSSGISTWNTFAPYLSFDSATGIYTQGQRNTSLYMDNLHWRKLDSIRIISEADQEIAKLISFNYNNNPNERLKLLSVLIGRSTDRPLKYTFMYNDAIQLPGYLSAMTDHWGYYNGIPLDINSHNFYESYYSYKVPNGNLMQAGILNRIIYPTGGMTKFEYEPHDYLFEVADFAYDAPLKLMSPRMAGGLRVKRIVDYPDQSEDLTKILGWKDYVYVENYNNNMPFSSKSSGVLGSKPKYYFEDYKLPMTGTTAKLTRKIFSSQTVLTGSGNGMGGHIGYGTVFEKFWNDSYIKYCYSTIAEAQFRDDQPDFTMYANRSPYNPINSNESTRGKLLSKNTYNSNSKLVDSLSYSYQKQYSTSERVRTLKAARLPVVCKDAYAIDATASGVSIPYSFLLSSEIHISYDTEGNNGVKTSKNYNYDSRKNIVSTVASDSRDRTISTFYAYPYNFLSTTIYNSMVAKNIVSPVIEKTEKLGDNILSFTRTNFGVFNNLFLPEYVEEQYSTNLLETRVTYNNFDTYGNLLDYTKDRSSHTSYLWGYNGQYPIAEIKNVSYSDVVSHLGGALVISQLNSISVTDGVIKQKMDALRIAFPNAQITSYTYKPLVGMTSKTDPRGVSEYYEYDSLNRLILVRDDNAKIIRTYCYNYVGQQVDCPSL